MGTISNPPDIAVILNVNRSFPVMISVPTVLSNNPKAAIANALTIEPLDKYVIKVKPINIKPTNSGGPNFKPKLDR